MKNNCNNCLNVISGQCVEYTGPDIKCANIKNGQTYDAVIVELVDKLCKIIDANEVELGCLYSGSGADKASIPEVIKQIIHILCTLTTDNLPTTANLHCIGDNVSKAAAYVQNQAMTYSITSNENPQRVYDTKGINLGSNDRFVGGNPNNPIVTVPNSGGSTSGDPNIPSSGGGP